MATPKKTANKRSGKKSTTSKKDWKAKSAPVELELPSGNVCLVKKIQMEKLITSGVLPDNMAKIAQQKIDAAGKGVPQDHKAKGDEVFSEAEKNELMDSPEKMAKMMQSFDRVAAHSIVEPAVLLHIRPKLDDKGSVVRDDSEEQVWEDIPSSERDPEELYTDEVDFADKAFVFQFVVGGDSNLERFRAEWEPALDALGDGEGV